MTELNDQLLLHYLQKQCTDEEFCAINTWLSLSEENRDYLFTLEEAYDAGRLYNKFSAVLLSQKEQVLRHLAIQPNRVGFWKKHLYIYKSLARYAALLAVLCTVGFSVYYFANFGINTAKHAQLQIVTDNAVAEVVLSDGTRVWLNHSATLHYPPSFTTAKREVFLDGEAYFEVAKNQQKPFVVHTEALELTVLGTEFNIRCTQGEDLAEATLLGGSVQVTTNNNSKQQVVLSPGQRVEYNNKDQSLQVKLVESSHDIAWKDNFISFDQASLADIVAVLERIYRVSITIDKTVNYHTYSGVLAKGKNVYSVLDLLNHSVPFSYKTTPEGIFIGAAH